MAKTQDSLRGIHFIEFLAKWKTGVRDGCPAAAIAATGTITTTGTGIHLKAKLGHISAKLWVTERTRPVPTISCSAARESPPAQTTSKRGKLGTALEVHRQDLGGESILVVDDE